jgi:hypothetical protein
MKYEHAFFHALPGHVCKPDNIFIRDGTDNIVNIITGHNGQHIDVFFCHHFNGLTEAAVFGDRNPVFAL